MDTTRRGFLGLLGAASAIAALPIAASAEDTPESSKSARLVLKNFDYQVMPWALIKRGDEVYAHHVSVDISPLRRGRVKKSVLVMLGPKTNDSHPDDLVGKAYCDLEPNTGCKVYCPDDGSSIVIPRTYHTPDDDDYDRLHYDVKLQSD